MWPVVVARVPQGSCNSATTAGRRTMQKGAAAADNKSPGWECNVNGRWTAYSAEITKILEGSMRIAKFHMAGHSYEVSTWPRAAMKQRNVQTGVERQVRRVSDEVAKSRRTSAQMDGLKRVRSTAAAAAAAARGGTAEEATQDERPKKKQAIDSVCCDASQPPV